MFRIVEETMKEYRTPKEFLRGGHEHEVIEKRSIIVYKNLYSDSNKKFVSIENVDFIHRKGILPTFYVVIYLGNNLIHQSQKSHCLGDNTKPDLYSERVT